jgi:signal transduction histidine kinase
MLELGLVGPLQPAQIDKLRCIRQSGDHLHNIVNDLLDLAKVNAGKLDLYDERGIDLRLITEACVVLVKERAREGKLSLSVEMAEDMPLLVADSTRLKQILLNLLSNAIKFTNQGGSIVVTGRHAQDDGVAIEVRDTGPGMTAAEIEVALAPFGQIDPILTRRHEGAGLGLPLARHLIELHGGSLKIESEKGQGTTVTITLPATRVLTCTGGMETLAEHA